MPKALEPRTRSPEPIIALTAMAVLVPVLLPLIVVFAPTLYLESDPRLAGEYITDAISFGPAGSMGLATVSIFIAALALVVTVWAGGRIRWWSCLFVALGIVPCLVHIPEHFNSRLHSGAWIAAACLGLAAAHLAQFRLSQRLMLSALIAVIVPFCLQAIWYVHVDHPATVQSFRDHLAENLARRGLAEGTPEAAKYLTRLEGNDVIGAVGMSNVFGSIVATIGVLSLSVLFLAWRQKLSWMRLLTLVIPLVMALWTLKLTQSKGATLALIMAVGLGVCVWGLLKLKPKLNARKLLPILCILFVLSGSVAVLLRGAAGPPDDHHGERSLLFRYHYWQGAARMIVNEPSRILLGVGQGGFKDPYEAVRNPISPEVVSSTHNVFVDYTVMLGLGGLAWNGLLLGWLWRAGVAAAENDSTESSDTAESPGRPPLVPLGLLATVVFLIQYAVVFPSLYAETAILWLIGAGGFVAVATYVIYPAVARLPGRLSIVFTLAAALVMLHAQIEMTFFWDAAAAFVWVIVGVASANSSSDASQPRKPLGFLPAAGLGVLGIVFTITVAEPTARHQAHLRQASAMLGQSQPVAALRELDQAATIIANDPTTTQWRVGLREEFATALARVDRTDDARTVLSQAPAVLDEAERAGLDGLGAARRRGSFAMSAYRITGDPDWLFTAEQAYARAAELSPNGLNDHVRLADVQWQLGMFEQAEANYREALQISNNYYLDPETQLPEAERVRIELRLK